MCVCMCVCACVSLLLFLLTCTKVERHVVCGVFVQALRARIQPPGMHCGCSERQA